MKALKLTAIALVLVSAMTAFAGNNHLRGTIASVPFDFNVGQASLPAGEYEVRLIGNVVMLVGKSGEKALAVSHSVEEQQTREGSVLDFIKVNGTYQLARVWQAGSGRGWELSIPAKQTKVTQHDATRVVLGK